MEGEKFCRRDGTRIVSRKNSLDRRQGWLVKHHGWRLIPYDYVGAEQVLGAFNTYEKDLLREYHGRFLKCFESA